MCECLDKLGDKEAWSSDTTHMVWEQMRIHNACVASINTLDYISSGIRYL